MRRRGGRTRTHIRIIERRDAGQRKGTGSMVPTWAQAHVSLQRSREEDMQGQSLNERTRTMYGNSVTIEGNMTKDLVVRVLESGKVVGSGSIARSGKTRDGREWGPDYFDFDIWGPQAYNVAASVKKGDRVVIDGSLKFGEWQSNGERRTKVSINADSVSPSLRWATAALSKNTPAPAPAEPVEEAFAEELI